MSHWLAWTSHTQCKPCSTSNRPTPVGQALHQDNYLRAQPGTCVAAWMAVDRCDEQNGCSRLFLAAKAGPFRTIKADSKQSYRCHRAHSRRPAGCASGHGPRRRALLQRTDRPRLLPNTSDDRFRRALIAHYIEGDAQKVSQWYFPVLRMDGSPIEIDKSAPGSQCGIC